MATGYKFYLKTPLIPNRASYVVAKDEQGKPVGEYNAYYRPRNDTVSLYPRKGVYYNYLPKSDISIFLLIKDY